MSLINGSQRMGPRSLREELQSHLLAFWFMISVVKCNWSFF